MEDDTFQNLIEKHSTYVGRLEDIFDDGEYMTDEEYFENYEYVETTPRGYELWRLKPHIQEQLIDEYGLKND
jgi:hypothetical protein